MNTEVRLVPIGLAAKNTLENLMTLYLHDLSQFTDDLKINQVGLFEYEGLDFYFSKAELKPFFIMLQDEIVGFVLLNSGKYVPRGIDFSVHEFFILKGFRGRGVAALAIQKLFNQYRGKYRIDQLANNELAITFWRKLYKSQGIDYQETMETSDGLDCYAQVFTV